jgi:hypothetical protein
MNPVQGILIELKGKSLVIVEQHVMLYENAIEADPEKSLEYFEEFIIVGFRKHLTTVATEAVHKSIIAGILDKQELVSGIQEILKEATLEVMDRIKP